MFYLDIRVNGKWMEYAKDERFDNITNIIRGMGDRAVRIRGTEGTWWRQDGWSNLRFTPFKFDVK